MERGSLSDQTATKSRGPVRYTRAPERRFHGGDVRNLGPQRCVIVFLKVNPKMLKHG